MAIKVDRMSIASISFWGRAKQLVYCKYTQPPIWYSFELFDTKVNFLFSRWNEKIHKKELDSLSRVLGQRIARWPTRLSVILQCQDKQWICNNCNTSYVDNIKILPIQRQAGTLANGCVQPSMVSQDFLSNILLNAINTCGI